MILRILPAVVALLALLGMERAAVDVGTALARFRSLRLSVLEHPQAASEAFCSTPRVAEQSCRLALFRGRDAEEAACTVPWKNSPARYYVVRLECRLPRWAGGTPLPRLDARLFR